MVRCSNTDTVLAFLLSRQGHETPLRDCTESSVRQCNVVFLSLRSSLSLACSFTPPYTVTLGILLILQIAKKKNS